jgi:hypothetical protein
MNFVQINLHNGKADTVTLFQQLAEGMDDIALIQETWIYRGQTGGLANLGRTVFSVVPGGNLRSCIFINNHIIALSLLEFCSRDAITVRITGGDCRELIVASVAFHMMLTNYRQQTK